MTVHVLFENEDWMPPLRRALALCHRQQPLEVSPVAGHPVAVELDHSACDTPHLGTRGLRPPRGVPE